MLNKDKNGFKGFSKGNIYYIIIVVNDMKKLNRKGFTLVELIATLLILALVVGIGSYTITHIIKNSKEKNYQLLINEIRNAVEEYHIECNYGGESDSCDSEFVLGFLVSNGYLKGNFATEGGSLELVNPLDDKVITECKISYSYSDGKYVITSKSSGNSCPSTNDFE